MKQFKQYTLNIDGRIYPPFGIDLEFANELRLAFSEQNKIVNIIEI